MKGSEERVLRTTKSPERDALSAGYSLHLVILSHKGYISNVMSEVWEDDLKL